MSHVNFSANQSAQFFLSVSRANGLKKNAPAHLYTQGFVWTELTVDSLIEIVKAEHAISSFKYLPVSDQVRNKYRYNHKGTELVIKAPALESDGYRHGSLETVGQVVMLDIDSGWTLEGFLGSEWAKYAFLIYTTQSHQKNKATGEFDASVHKFRVLYMVPELVSNEKIHQITNYLNKAIGSTDSSSASQARLFFGNASTQFPLIQPSMVLPELILTAAGEAYQAEQEKKEAEVVEREAKKIARLAKLQERAAAGEDLSLTFPSWVETSIDPILADPATYEIFATLVPANTKRSDCREYASPWSKGNSTGSSLAVMKDSSFVLRGAGDGEVNGGPAHIFAYCCYKGNNDAANRHVPASEYFEFNCWVAEKLGLTVPERYYPGYEARDYVREMSELIQESIRPLTSEGEIIPESRLYSNLWLLKLSTNNFVANIDPLIHAELIEIGMLSLKECTKHSLEELMEIFNSGSPWKEKRKEQAKRKELEATLKLDVPVQPSAVVQSAKDTFEAMMAQVAPLSDAELASLQKNSKVKTVDVEDRVDAFEKILAEEKEAVTKGKASEPMGDAELLAELNKIIDACLDDVHEKLALAKLATKTKYNPYALNQLFASLKNQREQRTNILSRGTPLQELMAANEISKATDFAEIFPPAIWDATMDTVKATKMNRKIFVNNLLAQFGHAVSLSKTRLSRTHFKENHLDPDDRDMVSAHEWYCTVARSGFFKTPAMFMSLAYTLGLQRAAGIEQEAKSKHKKELLTDLKIARMTGDKEEIKNIAVQLAHIEQEATAPKKYLMQKSNGAALHQKITSQDPWAAVMVCRDEIKGLFHLDQYQSKGGDSIETLLPWWNDDGVVEGADLINDDDIRQGKNQQVTIMGNTQPIVAARMFAGDGSGTNGLVARFKFNYVEKKFDDLFPNEAEETDEDDSDDLLDLEPTAGSNAVGRAAKEIAGKIHQMPSVCLVLSKEARKVWKKYDKQLTRAEEANTDVNEELREAIAKLKTSVLRFALILHCLDQACGTNKPKSSEQVQFEAEHTAWAAKFKQASEVHTQRVTEILADFDLTMNDKNSGDEKTKRKVDAALRPYTEELAGLEFNDPRPESPDTETDNPNEVAADVMNRATKLTDYYIAQFRLLQCEYRTKFIETPEDLGLRILQLGRTNPESVLTAREVGQKLARLNLNAGQIRDTFKLIVDVLPSEFKLDAKENLVRLVKATPVKTK
jgi:Protein of unknown function (DUF3987)